jgi:two-component system, cell cycle sensor histidine kinase and response regulator CckA
MSVPAAPLSKDQFKPSPDFWLAFTESLPDMVLLVDRSGTIIYINHVPCGLSIDYVIGSSAFDYTPPESRDDLRQSLAEIFGGAPARMHVQRGLTADGTTRWYSIQTGPVKVESRVAAAVIVARDVTEQREAELQLREWQKMDALGKLAGGIAHDFNNVLMVIGSTAQLVELEASEQQTRDDAGSILREVNRGTALTSQLLNFAGRHTQEYSIVNLNEVIHDIVQAMRRVMDKRVSLEERLSEQPLCVTVSRSQLEQIIMNLLINARDAIEGTGRIRIETEHRPSHVRLCVSDNGSGMSEEVRSRATKPFFTTKKSTGGTGLGLSVVNGIVTEACGSMEIESALGEGTTVDVVFQRIKCAV